MLSQVREREMLLAWIASTGISLDLAFSVHIPEALRWKERGWDDIWLSCKLRPYFADLDRLAMKSYAPAIPRVVVLHHSQSVGWHAHFQMQTPQNWSQVDFASFAYNHWRRSLGAYRNCKFEQSLLWSEPVVAGHMPYMLGHLSTDRVDWENTHLISCVELDQNDSSQLTARLRKIA